MGALVVTISSGGQKLDPAVEILSLEVRREVNRIPEAEVTLNDGSVALRKFELSNTTLFEPGKPVTIAAREGSAVDATLFEGLVVRHSVESRRGATALRVELKDAAFKLTRQRRSAVFRGQGDDEAIRKLIGAAGLNVGDLAATSLKHSELVQYHATDWDFIVSRADAQGLMVDAHRGTVSVRPVVSTAAPKVRLEHGLEDVDLELELDATDQWAEMTSQAWDPQNLAATQPAPAAQPGVKVGNLDAAAIARKLGGDSCALVHPALLPPGELSSWAGGRLARSRLNLLRGSVSIPGSPDLAPLDVVELAGVGNRFNGKALVTGVTHRIDLTSGWRTDLRFGLSPEIFARQPDIADVPAGGLLPPVQGLQLGVVAAFEADPDGEHRIKVLPSVLDPQQGAIWARVARPDAGQQRGQVFWPEPGDEVVIGFIHGDPRQAIVLGSLYGPANAPPAAGGGPSSANSKRAIVSKGGTVIGIDDQKNAVTIQTPGGNKVTVDDDAKAIALEDQNGNVVTLDSSGITLKSAADFTVDVAGNVIIKGSAVDVQ